VFNHWWSAWWQVWRSPPRDLPPTQLKSVLPARTAAILLLMACQASTQLRLVAEEINAAGGINGKMIELLIEDTVCKPEIATNTATKLVSDGAQMVLGGICSGATKAALPIYLDAGILVMSPSATNPPLTQSGDYPNFFRTIAPDDAQAQLDVDFAINNLGLSKIAVIHDKQDYGKGFAEFAKIIYRGVRKGGSGVSLRE
jgi:ABC-type branched-subunit amino acid transport system substrate-binding protein